MRARFLSMLRRFRQTPVPARQVGLAWYSEDQWALLRQVSADAQTLETTFAEWARLAETTYNDLLKKGVPVVKVPVNVADMARWCGEMGRPVNSEGRSLYAAFRLGTPKDAKLPFSR